MRLFPVILALVSTVAFAQPYGLSTRPAFAAFNDNKLPSNAAPVAGDWSTVVAYPNLTFLNPMGVLPLPGTSKLVVWGREGYVWSFDDTPGVTTKKLMLDLHHVCQGWDDQGMLGLAFHPGFATNRYVYLWYDRVLPGNTPQGDMNNRPAWGAQLQRLSRFTYNPTSGVLDPSSEYVIIDQKEYSPWHNGGGLFFHPTDGFLYLTNGNDANGGNDQRIDSGLFSGVLRIDVDKRGGSISHAPPTRAFEEIGPNWPNAYFIPNDNPFVGQAGVREEFFAIGLRSPHRMTIDPVTERIFIGDVGDGSFEEIDTIEPGEMGLNFQYGAIEGYNGDLTPPYIGINKRPMIANPHGGDGSAVIGGYVYRGTEFPELVGKYVFGDNGSNLIWYLDESTHTANTPASKVVLATMPKGPGPNSGNDYTGLSSFGFTSTGELLMCQLSSLGGKIYKLSRSGPPARQMPLKLSDTGVLSDLASLTPRTGFIAYDVNTPLWSDGAHKQRWFAIPSGKTIGYAPTGEWTFPTGSVFVKHFDLPSDARDPNVLHRLETRVLVRDDTGYVYGGSYKWRADQSDADLVLDAVTEDIPMVDGSGTAGTQPWYFPGRQDCTTCHTRASGGVLGIKTKQSHRDHDFAGTTDNQLRAWNHAGYFSPAIVESTLSTLAKLTPITDTTASAEQRMRSYLDANCASCHRPAGVHALWDARIDTPLDDAGIVNGFVGNDLGVTDARVIVPQDLAKSIMHKRLSTATELYKMPPVGKNKVDAAAVALLEQWIAEVTASPPKPLPTPWKQADIGNVALTGNAAYGGGAFTVQGAGDDIWNGADGMHFMYQDMSGDGTMIARNLSQTNTDGWAKAGVMIRESLNSGSKHAFTAITPGNGVAFQGRDVTDGESFYDGSGNGGQPKWLRIQRKGNIFISSASDDGSTWTEINRHTIVMTAKVKVGIAITSHNNGALCTAGFDNVFFMPGVPFIIQRDPQSQLARAGGAASLRVGVVGDTPVIQWRLNKVNVKGAISATHAINAMTLKQGGSYDVIVGGRLTSQPAMLAVVDEAIGNLNVVASGSTTLTVPFSGSGISYRWSKDGELLGSNSKISGSMTNKLAIKSFTTADEGDYTCVASAFGSSEQLGPYHLHLLKKPTITNAAPSEGIVSGSFTWQLSSDEPATRFTVSDLPSGLSYDAKTHRIVGAPNVSGTFTIKITPTNAAGTGTTQSFTLTIRPMPTTIVGGYAGLIDRHPGVNDDLGGRITMKVTHTGSFTGRLYTAAASYPLRGRLLASTSADPTYGITILRGNLAPLVLNLNLSRTDGVVTGTLNLGVVSTPLNARRTLILPPGTPDGSSTINAFLELDDADIGDPAKPQGIGWLRLTRSVSRSQVAVTAVAKLSDNTPVTFAVSVLDNNDMPARRVVYGGKGSIQGTLRLTASPLAVWPPLHLSSGTLSWRKLSPINSNDPSYGSIAMQLTVNGQTHRQPMPGTTFLNNGDVEGNAKITFNDGGIADAAQGSSANQTFRLTAAHKALFGNATINPCGNTLIINAGKGSFTGSLKLKDGAKQRTVNYEGVFVGGVGGGFFTLPQLPLTKTSPVLSGKVELKVP